MLCCLPAAHAVLPAPVIPCPTCRLPAGVQSAKHIKPNQALQLSGPGASHSGGNSGSGGRGGLSGGGRGGGSGPGGDVPGSGSGWNGHDWGVALVSLASAAILHVCSAQQAAARQVQQHLSQQGGGSGGSFAGLAAATAALAVAAAVGPSSSAVRNGASQVDSGEIPEPGGSSAAVGTTGVGRPPPLDGVASSAGAALPPPASATPSPKRIVLFVEPSPFTYTRWAAAAPAPCHHS
jgi:hypothetical protein